MRTIETIIEKEIKAHIDDSELCQAIIMEGTKDPKVYDDMIEKACRVTERLIKTNFESIISLATLEDNTEEEEPTSIQEIVYATEEDEEMLRFIEG